MVVPPPGELLSRVRALPAAAPLMERLGPGPATYLVGGAVRDLLRGAAPLDLDVVVEGDAIELARRLGGEIKAYGRFGTCTVRLDGSTYDLAGARRERYAYPGALPEVESASLEADLRRRDFSVNALAVALNGESPGRLSAVPGGLEDLEARRLRVLHEDSFRDDPTRLLRLARYGARLGFEPEAQTAGLAQAAVADGALATVSGERLGAELKLLSREPDPLEALAWLHRLGLDRALHARFGLRDRGRAADALALLPADGRRDRLALAAAAAAIPASELRAWLDELGFPAVDRDAIIAAAHAAEGLGRALARAQSASEIAAAVGGAPEEAVALAGAEGAREPARRWLSELRQVRLDISGDDLIAAGVAPGPAIGHGLRAALAAKLDGRVADRQGELEAALAAARAAPRAR